VTRREPAGPPVLGLSVLRLPVLLGLLLLTTGCGAAGPGPMSAPEHRETIERAHTDDAHAGPDEDEAVLAVDRPGAPVDVRERPAWLGTRALPRDDDGFGRRLPTPVELVDRRLTTPALPEPAPAPPPEDGTFRLTIEPVPMAIAARSTWRAGCPVALADLRYLTVTFIGFDGQPHTGELIVHQDVASDVGDVFEALHAAAFPIEEVRVIAAHELDLPPTGDGNVTSSFVCRPTVGGTRWSEHAWGRAVDINPFHNPYVRDELVLPELAGSYVDRSDVRPGMVVSGGPVTEAFAAIGWGWGGSWSGAATDPMHFSSTGR